MTSTISNRPRGSLTAEEIVEVASRLIHVDGLDGFSMRKLAAELGVNPMTIYLRFDNKDELLAAVARHLLGTIDVGIGVAGDDGAETVGWVDRVVALAHAVRSHLVRNREVLGLAGVGDHIGRAMLDVTEAGLALMEEVGFEGPAAVEAYRSLFWHAVGSAMADDTIHAGRADTIRRADTDSETPHPRFAALAAHFGTPDAERIFDHSTRALARGLRAGAERNPQ